MRILDKALKHERYLVALTGLRTKEFQRLVQEVQEPWKQGRAKRLLTRKRTNRPGQGRKFLLSTCEEELFVFLVWARTYGTLLFLEILLGPDESTISRTVNMMAPLLADRLPIPPPTGRRRIRNMDELKAAFPDIHEAITELIVDGTEQRIQRPKDKRKNKKYRSGKKKAHTVKTQVIVDAKTKRVLHVSKTVEGKRHDFRLFKETVSPMATSGAVKLLADSGYQGIQEQRPHLMAQTSRRRFRGSPPFTRKEKKQNRAFASVRVRVEHALGRLKKFHALADIYRHNLKGYNTVFRSIVAIDDLRLTMRAQAA